MTEQRGSCGNSLLPVCLHHSCCQQRLKHVPTAACAEGNAAATTSGCLIAKQTVWGIFLDRGTIVQLPTGLMLRPHSLCHRDSIMWPWLQLSWLLALSSSFSWKIVVTFSPHTKKTRGGGKLRHTCLFFAPGINAAFWGHCPEGTGKDSWLSESKSTLSLDS